jgi:hypothetical protein
LASWPVSLALGLGAEVSGRQGDILNADGRVGTYDVRAVGLGRDLMIE